MLRWMLALIIAGAMVYLAATVSFEGKTVFDRLLDVLGLSECNAPVQKDRQTAKRPNLSPLPLDDDTDRLTDQDRAKLDDLIQTKLKEQDKPEASGSRR